MESTTTQLGMKNGGIAARLALASAVTAILSSGIAQAAAITWDAGGGADTLWSNDNNWSDNAPPTGDDITFNATAAAAANTVTNTVGTSVSVNTLSFTNTGGVTTSHTTQIDNNQTLTVAGTGTAFNVGTAGSTTNAYFTGQGALSITGGTTANFSVGVATGSATSGTQLLDMQNLASFSANVGTFGVGIATTTAGLTQTGSVTLAGSNSITATTLTVGNTDLNPSAGAQASLILGQTNTINADTINVGVGKTGGLVQFRANLVGATLAVANRAGSGSAALNIGTLDVGSTALPVSKVDLSGGTVGTSSVPLKFSTIKIGSSSGGSSAGFGTGELVFGPGFLTATTINLGTANNGTSASSTGTGTLTMTTGAGTLTATALNLARQINAGTSVRNNANGTFAQNGGTAIITTITLGDRSNVTATTGANVTATYNLAGGTLRAQTIQNGANGPTTGTATRAFNWSGGTIQNLDASTNLTIANITNVSGTTVPIAVSGATAKSFTADLNRTIIVNAALGGSAGFSKDGTGTLVLSGNNTGYSGPIAINAGLVSGTGTATTGAVTVNDAGAIGAGTSIGVMTTGNLSFIDTGELVSQINTNTLEADLINAADLTLSNSAVLTLSDLGAGPALSEGTTFTLIDYSGTWNGGTFAGRPDDSTFSAFGNNFRLSYNGADNQTSAVTLTTVAVPEPTSLALVAVGGTVLLRRRRR